MTLNHKYLAITTGDQYIAYPHETEILGCQLTAGAFCKLNTALFPTIGVTSCEFSPYQRNLKQIRKACRVMTSPFVNDHALSLFPNHWIVLTLKPIILHVNCLQKTSYIKVKFPVDLIHLEDNYLAETQSV